MAKCGSSFDYSTASRSEILGRDWGEMRKFAKSIGVTDYRTKVQLADLIVAWSEDQAHDTHKDDKIDGSEEGLRRFDSSRKISALQDVSQTLPVPQDDQEMNRDLEETFQSILLSYDESLYSEVQDTPDGEPPMLDTSSVFTFNACPINLDTMERFLPKFGILFDDMQNFSDDLSASVSDSSARQYDLSPPSEGCFIDWTGGEQTIDPPTADDASIVDIFSKSEILQEKPITDTSETKRQAEKLGLLPAHELISIPGVPKSYYKLRIHIYPGQQTIPQLPDVSGRSLCEITSKLKYTEPLSPKIITLQGATSSNPIVLDDDPIEHWEVSPAIWNKITHGWRKAVSTDELFRAIPEQLKSAMGEAKENAILNGRLQAKEAWDVYEAWKKCSCMRLQSQGRPYKVWSKFGNAVKDLRDTVATAVYRTATP